MKISIFIMISILALKVAAEFNETTISAPTTTPKPKKIYKIEYPASGSQEACYMNGRKFKNAYLRGVKSPNLVTLNASNFETCQKLCCYEKRFDCRSFSFFKPLRQCFLMNLTRYNRKVDLITVRGYVHVQIIPEGEITTMAYTTDSYEATTGDTPLGPDSTATDGNVGNATTDSTGLTTEAYVSSPVELTTSMSDFESTNKSDDDGNGSEDPDNSDDIDGSGSSSSNENGNSSTTASIPPKKLGPEDGHFEVSKAPEKIISDECLLECGGNGECKLKMVQENSENSRMVTKAYCKCEEGFGGESCETKIDEEASFPVWIIVIIVIGALILILLIVACVLLQLYKKKKGEYRVVEHIRRWARRGKKPKKPDNDDEIAHMEDDPYNSSPTESVHNIENPDGSAATKTAV